MNTGLPTFVHVSFRHSAKVGHDQPHFGTAIKVSEICITVNIGSRSKRFVYQFMSSGYNHTSIFDCGGKSKLELSKGKGQ